MPLDTQVASSNITETQILKHVPELHAYLGFLIRGANSHAMTSSKTSKEEFFVGAKMSLNVLNQWLKPENV